MQQMKLYYLNKKDKDNSPYNSLNDNYFKQN